jgi:hypothetical protein
MSSTRRSREKNRPGAPPACYRTGLREALTTTIFRETTIGCASGNDPRVSVEKR